MAKNLKVTSVERESTSGAIIITFNAEESQKDLQFRLIQSEDLTELGIGVLDYGCLVIPASVTGVTNVVLEVELTGTFSGMYTATFTFSNIAQVGTSVELAPIE